MLSVYFSAMIVAAVCASAVYVIYKNKKQKPSNMEESETETIGVGEGKPFESGD